MKKTFLTSLLATTLLAFGVNAQSAPSNNLITDTSVGSVRLGMTYNEVIKNFKGYKYDLITGSCNSSEFSGLIFKIGNTGNIGVSDFNCNKSKIVEQITVCSSSFKTKEGVHPGMKISDLLKVYPRLTLTKGMDDIETYYPDSYKNIKFEFTTNSDGSTIGKYNEVEFTTKNFSKNGKIDCIVIDKIE